MLAGLGVSISLGIQEVRAHWQYEARAAAISRSIRAEQLPAATPAQGDEHGPDPLRALVAPSRLESDPGAQVRSGVGDGSAIDGLAGLDPHASGTAGGPVDPSGQPGQSAKLAMVQIPGQAAASGLEPVPDGPYDDDDDDDDAGDDIGPVVIGPDGPAHEGSVTASYFGVFNGVRDDLLLEPLRHARIKQVKFNRGGSSISLRIDFANGARAAFKPEQAAMHSIPRKEIAAYRVNRLLGLNAVPPAIGRSFAASDIIAAVIPSSQVFVPRIIDEMRAKDGQVYGELSWWIPVIDRAAVDGYEIDTTNGIVTWKRYLTVGNAIPEQSATLMAQISSMVLFDFVINNPDRWSGANARVSPDGRTLYFMDNTMSFGPDPDGHRKCRIYLKRSQKFSRSLVSALRNVTVQQVRAILGEDRGPYEYLLTDLEIAMFVKRRDFALIYVDELIAEHGENAVLVFP